MIDQEKDRKLGEDIFKLMQISGLNGLEIMISLVSLQCMVSISMKKNKSQMVELIREIINLVPADEFYIEQ